MYQEVSRAAQAHVTENKISFWLSLYWHSKVMSFIVVKYK